MTFLDTLLSRYRVVLTAVVLLSLTGVLAWRTMPRQEDPSMPDYWGMVVVSFPGADAETVERLVLEPVEERLAEVDDLWKVVSTAQAGVATLQLELRPGVDDVDGAWEEVRDALDIARRDFPDGVLVPSLDRHLSKQESVVLGVTGGTDLMALGAAAERIKRALLGLSEVGEVRIAGDPDEQITVALDDVIARRLGLDPAALAARLGDRNRVLPGGTIEVGGREITLRPRSEFRSLDEIRRTPIVLASGAAIPLSEVATVTRGPVEPATSLMRVGGEPAVGVGVVPREGIDVVRFGDAVRRAVDEIRREVAPLEIREITYQPGWVVQRIGQLGRSLALGVMIVAGVVIAFMGLRVGLIVSSIVPVVAFTALGIYALGGGVLHQISIAALVIALGMLVDNAIVVTENIQTRIDAGEEGGRAAVAAVRELAVPLASATGTTLAAFVPMLAARGATADFTRSIPLIVMLTLSVSYAFAVTATPVLARFGLRAGGTRSGGPLGRAGSAIGRLAVGRPVAVLLTGSILVAASIAVSGRVRRQFFPDSDRSIVIVDLKLQEGSHLSASDEASRAIERALLGRDDVRTVSAFVGQSAPHFYYNLPQIPFQPNYAQIVVTTPDQPSAYEVAAWVRSFVRRTLPGVEVAAQKLQQGPPVGAPVEVRLRGDRLDDLEAAASAMRAALAAIPGTTDVRHDLSVGAPTVLFAVDDAAAARHGVSRADVARAIFGRTRGLPVGEFRAADDPVPVVLRSAAGEAFPLENLEGILVAPPGGALVPLGQVASIEVDWRPAVLRHQDRRRVAIVSSRLEPGRTYSDVLRALEPALHAMTLPAGVTWDFGGEAEGSDEANGAMVATLPLGVLLLLGILMIEFNSFRRVAIVLATVPLAAAGVVPGLLAGGQPFGFMSLLGVVALVGIVVNNAIVLLDVVERRRAAGAGVAEAVSAAVERRLRPILLTSGTTIAGLLPLAFSPSSLWPPLAWAMISGLAASTLLTLLVVPALYVMLFDASRLGVWPVLSRRRWARATAGAVVFGLLVAGAPARAAAQEPERLTLDEVRARAASRPLGAAATDRATAAARLAEAERRATTRPVVSASASQSRVDPLQRLDTPIGSFRIGGGWGTATSITVVQPLIDLAGARYGAGAARREAAAADLGARRFRQELETRAVEAFLDVLAIDASRAATERLIESLRGRLAETDAKVAEGRTLAAEALKVRLALEAAEQDARALAASRRVAALALGHAVGLAAGVEPIWDGRVPDAAEEAPGALVAGALDARDDVDAIDARIRAAELRRQAVRAEIVPRVDLTAVWSRDSGSAFAEQGRAAAMVGVTWTPFAAGTRAPRAAAIEGELRALGAERLELERTVALEIQAALAALETARGAVLVGERGVEQAAETLRIEQERYRAGRITTNDLLEAEAALREQLTRRDLARLDVVRATARLELATGR